MSWKMLTVFYQLILNNIYPPLSCPRGTIFPRGSISCYFCVLSEPRISFIKLCIISGDSSGAVSEKYTLCCQTKEQTRECFRKHFFLCWGDGGMARRLLPPALSCSLKRKRKKECERMRFLGEQLCPLNLKQQLSSADTKA